MAEAVDKKTTATEGVPTVTFTIDGRETTVAKGTTILIAARQLGIDIPTFCWHPKLTAAGACRMCYVEIEKWPKLAISCATEVMDGMVVQTASEKVLQGRQAILDFTLANHPLDCPTCDKGGECTLQDLTFAHTVDSSKFGFQKHRFRPDDSPSVFDDLKIGPEMMLNRNRCILCYRCVRANKEAFGEFDLGAFERGNHTEINSAPGREVDNPFTGNLTEVCPVGALTTVSWRYKIRVWLTESVPSICPVTSSGSNTLIYRNQLQDKIFRITSRPNDDIDDGWLPDVTRYAYQIATSPERLKKPLIKKEGRQVEASWSEALGVINKRLSEIVDKKGRVCIGGMVSAGLDNGSLFAFSKLMRVVLGSNNIDFRMLYRRLPKVAHGSYALVSARPFKIADIDDSDVILLLGTDLLREHPNEYLRVRKAYNFHQSAIFVGNPYETKAADVARAEAVFDPGTEEIFINGLCLAAIEGHLVDDSRVGDLPGKIEPGSAAAAAERCGVPVEQLHQIAEALAQAGKVTVMAGEIISCSKDRELIAAAMCNLNRLFGIEDKGQIAILPRQANSRGAERLGLLPDPAPEVRQELAQLWGAWPEAVPRHTDDMLINMKKEEINGCLVIGSNPVMVYPDREFVRDALEGLDFLVVADLFETETTALADVVLPLASWAEYDGGYINLEGRSQQAKGALTPQGEAKPGYQIAEDIAQQLGSKLFASDAERESQIARLLEASPVQPWPDEFLEVKPVAAETAEEYPLPLFVGDDAHHAGHLTEKADSLTSFVSETYVEMSQSLAERLGLQAGDSARVESDTGKIIAPVRISPHLRGDTVFVPLNFSSTPVNSLLMRKRRVDRVRISKVVD